MQQSRSIQNIRRIAMMVGFALFLICIYKAGHEVASPKIAAGVQRTQVIDNSNISTQLGVQTSSYATPAWTVSKAAASNGYPSSPVATYPAGTDQPLTTDTSKKQANSESAIKAAKQITPSRSGKSQK